MNAQKAQIRTASVAIGIEPKSAHNGGYRVTAATSDRHAARLVFQSVSEPCRLCPLPLEAGVLRLSAQDADYERP
jgi:hypothetical protein